MCISKSRDALLNKLSEFPEANSKSFTVGVENIDEAKTLADNNSDINLFIVFIMADSGEQYITLETSVGDRYNMDAWHKGNDLVNAIIEKKKDGQKILVVINAPGPINLPWMDRVDAIVFSGMGGSESGNGLTDVLFGDVNPSGHLPYVWGTLEQYPAKIDIFSTEYDYPYDEGVFIGQRWFDLKNYDPIFPFGFGLSYTEFAFSDLKLSYNSGNEKETLVAKFNVENKGKVDGDAVPMLFLKFPDSVQEKAEHQDGYPTKLFKGFDKVFVKKGEKKEVTINVDKHSLSYYDVNKKEFVMATGTFTVYVGAHARDTQSLSSTVDVS
jgi:beta-glucosidase